MRLLSLRPDRLGHATFLDAEAKQFVRDHNIAIEICLTSNLLCVNPSFVSFSSSSSLHFPLPRGSRKIKIIPPSSS